MIPVFLLLAVLAACGSLQGGTERDTGVSGPADPWTEVTADGLAGVLGFRISEPEGASGTRCLWNAAEGTAEMQFALDGVIWTARAKKTDSFEDISGLHYRWKDADNYGFGSEAWIRCGDFQLCGELHLLHTDSGSVNLGLWFWEGEQGSFSLSLGTVADGIEEIPSGEVFGPGCTEG